MRPHRNQTSASDANPMLGRSRSMVRHFIRRHCCGEQRLPGRHPREEGDGQDHDGQDGTQGEPGPGDRRQRQQDNPGHQDACPFRLAR